MEVTLEPVVWRLAAPTLMYSTKVVWGFIALLGVRDDVCHSTPSSTVLPFTTGEEAGTTEEDP